MSIVPALDLRPSQPEFSQTTLPSNLEAEQALLGCLLYDNGAFERLHDRLLPSHFFEPLHGRLFKSISKHVGGGHLADPVLLTNEFSTDPAFVDLGGVSYLADLLDRAPPAASIGDYERVIHDLALKRELIRIGGDITSLAKDPANELTARDQISEAEQSLYNLAEKGLPSTGFVDFQTALTGALEMATEAYHRDGGLAGTSTGLTDLDQILGGLHPSDLLILAGRPSMGKTSLATNIAYNVASAYAWEPQPDGTRKRASGGVVAFFSLEMSAEQLAMRLLADASGVSGDKLRKGNIQASEYNRIREAAMEIQDAPLFIDATGGLSIGKMAARARRLKRSDSGLDLIIVDYLQLLTVDGGRGDNRVQEVSLITQSLKALAKDLNVPIIALSQLSRQVESREDKRPQLSDLRESGSIEQDADCVMFVYREHYYLSRAAPKEGTDEHLKWQMELDQVKGVAEVIIGKQRHGPIGTVKLYFNDDLTRFENFADPGRYNQN